MKPIVVFYDTHSTTQTYLKDKLGNEFDVVATEDGLSETTVGLAAEAEVVSVHVSSPVTADIMAKLPKLRHVACRSTGFDNVDLEYAKAHNITVSTVPGYGDETVAEYAFMLLLAVSRKLLLSVESVHAGVSTPEKLVGADLAGKTLGVIGTGRIGRRSVAIGRGFGMTVIAYDPFPNEAAARDLGYEYVGLDDLLKRSDAITLHAPATEGTEHILNADAFAKMKTGVLIVNTARGSLIDTPALIKAIEEGKVGGAGLDVLEGEELIDVAPELQLLGSKEIDAKAKQVLAIDILGKLPNVILTHHNAYNSTEALNRIRDTTVANLQAWHAGNAQNLVSVV